MQIALGVMKVQGFKKQSTGLKLHSHNTVGLNMDSNGTNDENLKQADILRTPPCNGDLCISGKACIPL